MKITLNDISRMVSESVKTIEKMKLNEDNGKVFDEDSFRFHKQYDGDVEIVTRENGTIEMTFTSRDYESNVNEENGERLRMRKPPMNDNELEQYAEYARQDARTAYEQFICKLKPFMNTAKKNNCEILVSEPKDIQVSRFRCSLKVYIKIIDSQGNASSSIAKNGYEYCATVVPIELEPKSGETAVAIPSLVTMAPKYRNSNLSQILRSVGMSEKCAGCGRTIPRGKYIVYINTQTGELAKLGVNCAVNKFGYSLNNNFVNRIAMMFSTASYHDLVAHDPDGFPIQPQLSIGKISNRTYSQEIMRVITYHVMTEPSFNIKNYGYENINYEAQMLTTPSTSEDINDDTYRSKDKYGRPTLEYFSPKNMQIRLWDYNNADKVPTYDEYAEWWEKMEPIGDWETTCKTVAMAMTHEAFIPKKNVGKFEKIVPYTIAMFLKKKDQPSVESLGVKPGDEIRDVRCRVVETRYFESYNSYLVRLMDNEGHTFKYWSKWDTAGQGDKTFIIKSAYVKEIKDGDICLNYVNITTEDREEEIARRNQEVSSLNYPPDKTRLRNVPMTVKEIKRNGENVPSKAIVVDQNGCWYYIFLVKSYQGFVSRVIPFPYNEGDVVNVTGTVERKEGRNGVYYSLSRVVLPKEDTEDK